MSLSTRIFLIYFIFVSISSYFILTRVLDEIKPGVRQTTEETLVDTANLLAEIVRAAVKNNQLQDSRFQEIFEAYRQRKLRAQIWGIEKKSTNHRIYITDSRGIVLLDSMNIAVGQDFSHWNDVYLTLNGKYGARSTLENPADERSSVMYVAAPIMDGNNIIGVVTVAKPNHTVQPYIDRSRRHLLILGGIIVAVGLFMGMVFSWWLTLELRRLRHYALSVSSGERVALPESKIASGELKQLAHSLESMRIQLDGKAYIERYVQTLAHELKSPLAGISAAAELLQSPMENEQRQRFVHNIDAEARRMHQFIERLLHLAMVEQRQTLQDIKPIAFKPVWDELIESQSARILKHHIQCTNTLKSGVIVMGELFLLRQAFANLLENALDFTPDGGTVCIDSVTDNQQVIIQIENQGPPIPDFAFARLTERFYSLPRPYTGKKSTGLGLNFVQEVAALHRATLVLKNTESGVQVSMAFWLHTNNT